MNQYVSPRSWLLIISLSAIWGSAFTFIKISLEEAFERIKQAFDRKQELENAGYYLSPNKTEGVKPFNWEKIVEESVGSIDAAEVYKFNKIDLILPNLIENFYQNPRKQKRGIIKDIMASALYGTAFDKAWQSGVKDYGYYDEDHPEAGGAQTFEVNTMDDLLNYFVEQGLEDKAVSYTHLTLPTNREV